MQMQRKIKPFEQSSLRMKKQVYAAEEKEAARQKVEFQESSQIIEEIKSMVKQNKKKGERVDAIVDRLERRIAKLLWYFGPLVQIISKKKL